MNYFIKLDQALFHLINSTLTHPVLDGFFPFWTDFQKTNFFKFIIFPALMILIYKKSKNYGIGLLVTSLVIVNLVDNFVSLIKPVFARLRPGESALPFEVILRGSIPGGYSFPSGHATDAFFMAIFLSVFFPKVRNVLLLFASLTSYSRIYCGIHYPLDVVGGAVIGSSLGLLFAWLIKRFLGVVHNRWGASETI